MTWRHLLLDDFWTPVWPNLAASAVLGPLVWLKLRAIHRLHKQHFEWHQSQGKEPPDGA